MGGCFSKKGPSFGVVSNSSSSSKVGFSEPTNKPKPKSNFNHNPQLVEKEDDKFVMKDRKSHDKATQQKQQQLHKVAADGVSSQEPADSENVIARNINFIVNGTDNTSAAPVRTSSCSKEELDAILIQCGRLSRSGNYSGSKRSYDFDGDADNDGEEEQHHQRERSRQSRPSPQGRRRTPSRERERSNSKERISGSGSRRVSRSPGRRSGNSSSTTNVAAPSVARPGKLVSVPPTVSSLAPDKSKGSRGVASPRAQSPARVNDNPRAPSPARGTANGSNENVRARSPARTNANVPNENIRARSPARTNGNVCNQHIRARSPARTNANVPSEKIRARSPARTNANGCVENQQASLSRNTSRKAEQSPYRRNPLSEIDPNSLAYPQPTKANSNNRVPNKSKEIEADGQKPRGTLENKTQVLEEAKVVQTQIIRNVVVTTTVPQTLTRSRSSRQSQDLDQNPEALLNPNPSYASLLLEDIQNFHHKSTPNPNPTSILLPPCVTKACSILEAVDDLNHRTSSNLSCTFSEDRMRTTTDQFSRNGDSLAGKKRAQHKDPFVESEVIVNDDLMEPSLQKYVTVGRGRGGELDGEESTGSNSVAGGQQHKGVSSSSWEPNSADSTDHWASSRSNAKTDDQSRPLESGLLQMEDPRRGFSGKRRDQQTGIGRGRVGGNRAPQAAAAVAAST